MFATPLLCIRVVNMLQLKKWNWQALMRKRITWMIKSDISDSHVETIGKLSICDSCLITCCMSVNLTYIYIYVCVYICENIRNIYAHMVSWYVPCWYRGRGRASALYTLYTITRTHTHTTGRGGIYLPIYPIYTPLEIVSCLLWSSHLLRVPACSVGSCQVLVCRGTAFPST